MRIDRLTILRDYLRDVVAKLPPRRFNMEIWWAGPEDDPHDCGTAGCALGWACQIPEFAQAGLRIDHTTHGYPKFENNWGGSAGAAFFELGYRGLFYTEDYDLKEGQETVSIEQVIERLNELIAEGTEEATA